MTELTVFAPSEQLLPLDELFELTANEAIEIMGDEEYPTGYIVRWQDVVVTLQVVPDATSALNDIMAFVNGFLAERDDNKARKNLRRIASARLVIQIQIEPEPDVENKAGNLVLGVLSYYPDSFFWGDGALYNDQGKRFIGHDDARPRFFIDRTPEDSAEAIERKARTLSILKREKVPTIEHLAVKPDSTQATQRPPQDITARLLALLLIAEKAEGGTLEIYEQKVAQADLREAVSTDEWEYAHTAEPIQQDTIKFSQRVEAAWVLAWALGLIETLERPEAFCDSERLQAIGQQSTTQLVARSQPRSLVTLLDAADLHYRYHWAVNDAELYGTKMPSKLQLVVVYERHYALNWLIGNEVWDSVNTDT